MKARAEPDVEKTPAVEEQMASSPPLAKYSDLLTVENMAEVLDASTRTVYRMADRNELPHVKVGRRLYFPKNQLLEHLRLVPQQ